MDPQAAAPLIAPILQFGAFGALVLWIVFKVIPSLQSENTAARSDFKDSLGKMTTDFRDEMRLERESHREEHTGLRAEIHDLGEKIDHAFAPFGNGGNGNGGRR